MTNKDVTLQYYLRRKKWIFGTVLTPLDPYFFLTFYCNDFIFNGIRLFSCIDERMNRSMEKNMAKSAAFLWLNLERKVCHLCVFMIDANYMIFFFCLDYWLCELCIEKIKVIHSLYYMYDSLNLFQ